MDARATLGRAGEDAAARHLQARGYEILDRNYRCAIGEIDVVARCGDTIVFCEVKTRRTDRWGQPSEAVSHRKQARLRRLAGAWLTEHRVRAEQVRFDVVSVIVSGSQLELVHLVNAF